MIQKQKNAKKILASLQDFGRETIPNFDFHVHTNWTDGDSTVEAMHAAAVNLGLSHILFSEHVRQTSETWFFDFAKEVQGLDNTKTTALLGMETKIMNFQGDLDTTTSMINKCDLVMASVHRFPGEEGIIDKNTNQFNINSHFENPIDIEFSLANLILENPDVDILGHPFGMTYKRFKLIPPREKIVQLIQKAAKTGVAFEINSRYHPNLWELIDLCKKYEATISIGSNAHSVNELGIIVNQLKRGMLCNRLE